MEKEALGGAMELACISDAQVRSCDEHGHMIVSPCVTVIKFEQGKGSDEKVHSHSKPDQL